MKCIVTGGAGFIGGHLVDHLIKEGHEVIVIDNESAETSETFYWRDDTTNHKIDILDYESLEPVFEGVDWVFHMAAESRVMTATENPRRAVEVNASGTCNVLQASRKHNIKRVMYSSTSAAYGLTEVVPQDENVPLDCLNPYSTSKVCGEEVCKMYTKLFEVDTVIFRYFNVYGERAPVKGQYAPVVGRFLKQKNDGEALTIVGDGEQRRDMIHVSDIVSANLAAATTTNKQAFGEIFNIGTGVNYSVNAMAALISDNTTNLDARPGEARVTLSNSDKAKQLLGWESTVDFVTWVKDNL